MNTFQLKPARYPAADGRRRAVLGRVSLLAALLLCRGIQSATAQDLSLAWHTLDGGGGTSTGGVYTVSGTIGQPDAGSMSGGNYSLAGGFWAFPGASGPPAPPALHITRLGGNVRLAWPNPSTGFQLQQATSLMPLVAWVDVSVAPVVVGEERQVTLPIGSTHRFFRLRKP